MVSAAKEEKLSEHTRAGLLLLAMLSSLGVVPILMRGLKPTVVLAVHAVGMCVAFGAAVSALTGADSGPPLALAYTAMLGLIALEYRSDGPSHQWLRLLAVFISVTGLIAALVVQLWPERGQFVSIVVAALALIWSAPASITLLRRARSRAILAWARADRAAAIAILLAALAVALGSLEAWLPGLWPVTLGAAGALLSSVRAAPWTPPTAREWTVVALCALSSTLAMTLALGPRVGLLAGYQLSALMLGILALSRGLLFASQQVFRPQAQPPEPVSRHEAVPLSSAALGVLAPMLDDGSLRRPPRPRLVSRVPARRILEAAIERARTRQARSSSSLSSSLEMSLNIEIIEDGADVDIEGDVTDIAEALCAVVDNALQLRAQYPALLISIHLRGGHRQVTFEVSDDLFQQQAEEEERRTPDAEHPFFSAAPWQQGTNVRPGLGLGLARAKVLLARQGGLLLTRPTEDGSCVQVTIPRRRHRPQFALA